MNVNMKDNKSFHEILINETLFLHIIITPSETTFLFILSLFWVIQT